MKVLLTATVQSHICQFHKPLMKLLKENGYEVHVAARDNLAEKNGLAMEYADRVFDVLFQRSPKDKRNIDAYKQLKNIIKSENYDLIVCNTPMGGILTRLAARTARKKGTKVIYIAHGFHFYKGSAKKNWLLFYPIEKVFSRISDMIITVNQEDYECAKKHFKTNVQHIHGVGVSTDKFFPTDSEEKAELRTEFGINNNDFVILCTGELNNNKNQSQLIFAASILKNKIPELKILLAGNGPNEEKLINLIKELGLDGCVTLIGYRTDLNKIVSLSDIVVSCSRREGMPLNIIEAMLCAKPIVATFNRGHNELITDGENGYLVSPDSPEDMADSILKIYSDNDIFEKFANNSIKFSKQYTVDVVVKELENIFFS